MTDSGIEPQKLAAIIAPAHLETFRLSKEGARSDQWQTYGLVYVLVMLLYISVVLYGAAICRSIVEEKISRIVEVMLASLQPFELLMGKVLGVGLVGLCQIAVWCVTGLALLGFRGKFAEMIGALEGPVALTECSAAERLCPHEGNCAVRGPWQLINGVVRDSLMRITLADLIDPTFGAPLSPLEPLGREGAIHPPSAFALPRLPEHRRSSE